MAERTAATPVGTANLEQTNNPPNNGQRMGKKRYPAKFCKINVSMYRAPSFSMRTNIWIENKKFDEK